MEYLKIYHLTKKCILIYNINNEEAIFMSYVITIGRQYGSGGRYIARELAKKLKINFYDNELLIKAAERTGFSVDYIKANEEKKDSIFAFMGLNDIDNTLTAVQKVSNAQFAIIRNLADTESCVIVGRCANYVLKDHQNVLNVFIHAPIEDRIKRAVTYYNLPEKNAKEAIKKMDRKRESYHNYFTDEKWGDATNYDLCLNSSLGIEECVDVIIEAARKKFHLDF